MKQSDLRIGNFVGRKYWNPHPTNPSWEIEVGKILELKTKHALVLFKSGEKCKIQYDELQPILLTEDRLVKFGAKCFEFDNVQPNQYRIGERLYVIRNGEIVDYGTSVILKYVHKFQNHYYANSETELEITNP